MAQTSKSCSSLEENVYGFKIWKWKFTFNLGGSEATRPSSDKQRPCCKKATELTRPMKADAKGIRRDSSWEFFRFGAVKSYTANGCARHRRNLDIIRDRSRSVANLYYTPIDSQGSDNEDDTDPRDPNLDDESHLYSEIKDAPWVKKRLMEETVEIEPLPTIQSFPKTPIVPKKAAKISRTYTEVVPPQLPPYPSTQVSTSSGGRRRHLTGK